MKITVRASSEYGIVIRAQALRDKGVDKSQVFSVFENVNPLDTSADLLSFGPHFGREAMENLGSQLAALGLDYLDDFFYFEGDFPSWAQFFVGLDANHS